MPSSVPDEAAFRAVEGLREHEALRRVPDRYQRLDELGRGGMAVVYRARDRHLNRDVALKILRDDAPVDPADQARFQREAEAAARLSHPNVVTIYDSGPGYLVMELVEGRPFRESWGSDPRAISVLVEKVARAVHSAHEQGIIHRDLKPANILVTRDGEPKVADFGIAHWIGARTALTQSGVMVGTPQYMAPEQVENRRLDLSPRTDVYGLGAILYEALAGMPPHVGATPLELFRKIAEVEPAPLSRAPRELETITRKAMAKDPRQRYATALEFAQDLDRWRNGLPILARPPSALSRIRRQIARRKVWVASISAALVTLVFALIILVPRIGESRRILKLWGDLSVVLADAELYGRAGKNDLERQRLERGITVCREHLATHEDAEAHYFLGRLLRRTGRRTEAIASLSRAIDLDPGLGEGRFERGLAWVEEYETLQMRILQSYAGRPPGSGAVTPPHGEALEALHPELKSFRDRAVADLSMKVGRSAYFREIDALYGRAELERMRWNWDESIRLLEAVLHADPVYVRALQARAKLELFRTNYEKAAEHASAALREHKGLGEAYLVRGRALFWKAEGGRRDVDRAEILRNLDEAVRLLEDKAPAWTARGDAKLRGGDISGALEDYSRAIEANPRDAIAWNHRGVARMSGSDPDQAMVDFTESIRLSPGYAMASANRAKLRVMLNDTAGAIRDARAALESAPPRAPYRIEIEDLLRLLEGSK